MIKQILMGLTLAVTAASMPAVLAEEELCMECHEPAEDWEGLDPGEILIKAQDPDNEDHEDNRQLSVDQLKAIIAKLLAEQ